MAGRSVYGNTVGEDGWPFVDEAGCNWVTVPGTNVTLEIQQGQPTALLRAWAADWNAYIEPLRDADSACWTATNSVSTSNHLGGTAIDLNWESHPMGPHAPDDPHAGFTAAQVDTINEMKVFYTWNGVQMVWWANDWDSPHDSMHSQCGYNTYGNPLTQQFIDRFIRPDGFSTFRRGGTVTPPPPVAAGLTAQTLNDAMSGQVSLDRYAQLLPAYRNACVQAGLAGNLNRLAMFAAQLGEESGGLQWMEEIASGSEYEGRSDLGNTQPGDGVRFKGRGPIQITGRSNYSQLSQWAFSKGYVPSPTFFVDNPTQLSADQYGFLGPVWYWTVARPQINSLCDAGDIVGVTRAINGGTNGLADRTNRWNHCLSMGLAALDVQGTPDTGDDDLSAQAEQMIADIHRELTQRLPSRSPLRHLDQTAFYPDGLVDTMAGMLLNTDGSEHVQYVSLLASYGHPPTLALLQEVASAAGDSRYPDRQDDAKLAEAILAEATSSPAPVVVNSAVAPAPQIVYVDRPLPAVVEPPSSNGSAPSTGQVIGNAYDALEALRLADALPIEGRAPLAALISVLSTKNGSQIA